MEGRGWILLLYRFSSATVGEYRILVALLFALSSTLSVSLSVFPSFIIQEDIFSVSEAIPCGIGTKYSVDFVSRKKKREREIGEGEGRREEREGKEKEERKK